jgi:hypothetical protein
MQLDKRLDIQPISGDPEGVELRCGVCRSRSWLRPVEEQGRADLLGWLTPSHSWQIYFLPVERQNSPSAKINRRSDLGNGFQVLESLQVKCRRGHDLRVGYERLLTFEPPGPVYL